MKQKIGLGGINKDLVLATPNSLNKNDYIRSAKDLVTLSQLKVAKAKVTHKGGYPFNSNPRIPVKPYDAYIIDLIGLQFQTEENTGRLVFLLKMMPFQRAFMMMKFLQLWLVKNVLVMTNVQQAAAVISKQYF